MWPIIMHVNYCEQGQSIDEICSKAVDWGFDGVEFRRRRSGIEESVEGYLDSIADAAGKYGLKYVIFGSPGVNLMTDSHEIREREINDALNFYMLAAERFKLSVCNAFTGVLVNPDKSIRSDDYDKHGSYAAEESQWQWAAEGFRILGDAAQKLGFRFAFETHMNYIHDVPAAAVKLVNLIDRESVGVNIDYGNLVYFCNVQPLNSVIERVGKKIYYVHLKNSVNVADGKRIPVGLGDGVINNREFLKLLKKLEYKGPLCIEAPRAGDREWYAKQDIAYIKSVIKEIM